MEKIKWKKILKKSKSILVIILIACIITGTAYEYRSVLADNSEQTDNLTVDNSALDAVTENDNTQTGENTGQDTFTESQTNPSENQGENSPENTEETMPGNTQENQPGGTEENVPENTQENQTENTEENVPENTQENQPEGTEENIPENTQENQTENTEETIPENTKEITPIENEPQEMGDMEQQVIAPQESENEDAKDSMEEEGDKPEQNQPEITKAEDNTLKKNSEEFELTKDEKDENTILEETIEESKIMSGTTTKTIYFDTVMNGAWSGNNNGWTKDCSMYIYLMDVDSTIRPMAKSARTNDLVSDSTGTLWEYTITEAELAKCTGIIFINQSKWGDNSVQTTDILMSTFADDAYPCFVLTDQAVSGKKVAKKLGNLQPKDFGGKKMYLYDMTDTFHDTVQPFARFSGTGAKNTLMNMVAVEGKEHLYEITIPEDESDMVYTTVEFCKSADTVIVEAMDYTNGQSYDSDSSNTYYYGATKISGKYSGYWEKQNTEEASLKGLTLYFDNLNFPVEEGGKLKIGSETVDLTTAGTTSLSYELIDSEATQQTMFTFIDKDKNEYNFFWRELSKNQVNLIDNFAQVARVYNGSINKIYFDSTLSNLRYSTSGITPNGSNGAGDYGMPNSSGKMYYYMTGAGKADLKGEMAKEDDFTKGSNKFKDVYSVELPEGYTNIVFSSFEMSNATNYGGHGESTTTLTIPSDLSNPCFYADTSDMVIYDGGVRGGYWAEVYTIRDPQQRGTESKEIVDIPSGTEVRDSHKLYVNTTFYDFYTDYELNGNNRDTYNAGRSGKNDHRIYQPFRQFDQALSAYYTACNASSPLYWGNFQNYPGSPFHEIAGDLNLFGYDVSNRYSDLSKKFYYENNSMWGRNGNEINNAGKNAVQGLVSDTLSNGKLMMKTASGTVEVPFLNESFLAGNNAKNTVLGKVYNNVSFPFNKKSMKSNSRADLAGQVDYWVFDSKDTTTNRRLKKDSTTNSYYLEESGNVVKGITTFGITSDGNFFPFNGTEQSGNSALLNYGFAMKMEVSFRLTEDGQVINSEGEKTPIEFNFSGDDDIWVFVDDKLALDIGGGHGEVSGYLDFSGTSATKKAYVSGVKDVSASNGWNSKTNSFTINGSNTDTHTLSIFYQERGIWESNMYISFNFPDENTFEVEKQIDDSNVNQELFAGVFDDTQMFPFVIRNQATHYGSKEVNSGDVVLPIVYNDTFNGSTISKTSTANTFEKVSNFEGKDNVVKWRAKYDDISGTYKEQRMGVIAPASGDVLDASKVKDYVSFQYYYDETGIPSLNYMYLELEDAGGNTLGGYLNGKTYGVASMKGKSWGTVTVDLSKLSTLGSFNYSKIKSVKFAYNKEVTFYLDDITFLAKSSVSKTEGFVTNQKDIADYGSAESGQLEYPAGAVYTIKSGTDVSDYMKIGSDGKFTLANGQTAVFTEQFRRGSYISLQEDVEPDVFETSYTVYEGGKPVTSMSEGSNIILGSVRNLTNVSGTAIDDGRTEVSRVDSEDSSYKNKGYPESRKPEDNTIVFRSFANPDMITGSTKIEITYINKVKTGSLTIKKEQGTDSDTLDGDYTFRITFTNVAGMGLEGDKTITKTITLKAGESQTIKGIPINTNFTIVEETPEDGSVLTDVTEDKSAGFLFDNQTKVVTGSILAARQDYSFTFTNTKNIEKPVISIVMNKLWKDSNGQDLTSHIKDSINVSLQRRAKGSTGAYTTVSVNGSNYTTIQASYEQGWTYTFENQDKYVDYKAEPQVEWEYRVVELDNSNQVIEEGGFADSFKVSYDSKLDPVTGNVNNTITNTYQNTNIQITKVDAADVSQKLSDVEFTLEKLNDSGEAENSFDVITKVTTVDGIAVFSDLKNGTYRITETKAKEDYNLLKNPIIVVIDRDGICTVDGENAAIEADTLKMTVSNKKKFQLPFTGGYGRTIFMVVGIALLLAAAAVYILKKNNRLAFIKSNGNQ